jgi:hypothetical protein
MIRDGRGRGGMSLSCARAEQLLSGAGPDHLPDQGIDLCLPNRPLEEGVVSCAWLEMVPLLFGVEA